MNALEKARELAAKNKKRPTREFVDNFEKVANHYKLKNLGEYETAKQAARDDLDNAIVCYAALAKLI